MRRTLLALLLLGISTVAQAGTLTLNYTGTSNGISWTATASIDDTDATTYINWAKSHYASAAACATNQGCFNTWADDVFNTLRTNVLQWLQATAVATATSSTTGITVTPAQ